MQIIRISNNNSTMNITAINPTTHFTLIFIWTFSCFVIGFSMQSTGDIIAIITNHNNVLSMYIIIDILYKYSGAKIHTKTIPQEARKHKKGLFKWHPPIAERSGIIISKKTSALIISPHNIPIKIQDTIFKI